MVSAMCQGEGGVVVGMDVGAGSGAPLVVLARGYGGGRDVFRMDRMKAVMVLAWGHNEGSGVV